MKSAPTTQDMFRTNKEAWLHEARQIAQSLLLDHGSITIEDLLEVHPLPKYIKKNFLGKVFQADVFHAVGYTRARRTIANGHVIRVWELNSSYYPSNVLARHRNVKEYGDVA